MSLRSLVLAPLVASGLLAVPVAAADRVLVAGPDGVVLQGDSVQGNFVYFGCACGGPIVALAADDQRLYAADELGQLLVFDVQDGAFQALTPTGVLDINALATADGGVFAGTESGHVLRLDPFTGEILQKRIAPAAVGAMLSHEGFLFIGSAGAIYRAPAAGGEFEYFSCFCFSGVRGMSIDRDDLVVADQFGIVARVDDDTGAVLAAFFVGSTNVMAASRGELLLYYDGGTIPLVDAWTGTPTGSIQSPIAVNTMLVIPSKRPRFVPAGPRRP